MARLSHSDLESLLDYLEEISSLGELPEFREGILPCLRRLVPCDVVAYNELDPRTGEWDTNETPAGYLERTNAEAFVRFMGQHPLIPYYSRPGRFPPMQLADVVTRRELHRLELYQEFFRPIDVEHQIILQLPASLPRLIGIPLMRSRAPFSERDRLVLDRLRPHLVHGYLRARARTRLRRVLKAYEAGDERDRHAVLILDPHGGVEHASGPAEHWLQSYFPRPDKRGSLPEAVETWLAAQQPRPLVQERNGGLLQMRLLPGRDASEPDTVLMAERRPPLSPEQLRTLGLTRREAEVLARAASGGSYEQIGADLWISPRTVHKHLEHVYAKLGVDSRAAAVTRAFERLGATTS